MIIFLNNKKQFRSGCKVQVKLINYAAHATKIFTEKREIIFLLKQRKMSVNKIKNFSGCINSGMTNLKRKIWDRLSFSGSTTELH